MRKLPWWSRVMKRLVTAFNTCFLRTRTTRPVRYVVVDPSSCCMAKRKTVKR